MPRKGILSSTYPPVSTAAVHTDPLQVAAAKGLAEDEASRLRSLLAVTAGGEGVPERGLHLLRTYEQRLASAQHRLAMQVHSSALSCQGTGTACEVDAAGPRVDL